MKTPSVRAEAIPRVHPHREAGAIAVSSKRMPTETEVARLISQTLSGSSISDILGAGEE